MNSSIFVVCFLFAVAAALPLADVVPEVSGLEGLGEVVVEAANAAEAVRKARQIIDVDILLGGGGYNGGYSGYNGYNGGYGGYSGYGGGYGGYNGGYGGYGGYNNGYGGHHHHHHHY